MKSSKPNVQLVLQWKSLKHLAKGVSRITMNHLAFEHVSLIHPARGYTSSILIIVRTLADELSPRNKSIKTHQLIHNYASFTLGYHHSSAFDHVWSLDAPFFDVYIYIIFFFPSSTRDGPWACPSWCPCWWTSPCCWPRLPSPLGCVVNQRWYDPVPQAGGLMSWNMSI